MLTDAKCKNATCPADRRQARFTDSGGMYLQVSPNGSKRWFLKYRVAGKEKQLALGSYPTVSLADARRARDVAKLQKAEGIDPAQARRLNKLRGKREGDDTFKGAALEWHAKQVENWSPGHANRTLRQLERDLFPWLADRSWVHYQAAGKPSHIWYMGVSHDQHRTSSHEQQPFRDIVLVDIFDGVSRGTVEHSYELLARAHGCVGRQGCQISPASIAYLAGRPHHGIRCLRVHHGWVDVQHGPVMIALYAYRAPLHHDVYGLVREGIVADHVPRAKHTIDIMPIEILQYSSQRWSIGMYIGYEPPSHHSMDERNDISQFLAQFPQGSTQYFRYLFDDIGGHDRISETLEC